MQITDIRLREVTGTTIYPDDHWQERQRTPLDIYPDFKARTGRDVYRSWGLIGDGEEQWIKAVFLEIETDDGLVGIAGPVNFSIPCLYIEQQLKPLLMGRDPFATELLWDQMYRLSIHGRKGYNMHAISYVDAALWDIKGKALGLPVHRLLGGPVQQKIPAYVSTVGFPIDPESAYERVKHYREAGFTGTKWFVREGPTDGPEGERKTIALMKALREAAGTDMKIMLDSWGSWDVLYTLKMARLLAEYEPYWFEEPVMIDMHASYARLRQDCPVRIAGGEHEFTRWGAKQMMDVGACDVYQMDTLWAGGISELVKICTLASTYGVEVIPHGLSLQVNAQVSFAHNAALVPMMEYLDSFNHLTQYFIKQPMMPVDGHFLPPEAPGIGIEIDQSKVESEQLLSWN